MIEGNTRAKTNTLHIFLNFDVGEKLSQNKLNQIATTYMDKIEAQSKPKQDFDLLQKVDKAVYGKSETKKSIDNIVSMVMQNYNSTSLIEFNTVLRQFNVMADRGKEGSTMYQKNGSCIRSWMTGGIRSACPLKRARWFRDRR